MKKLFSILFATVLAVSLCLVPAVASADGPPAIDGVIDPVDEWDAYYLGTSVTTWSGGMSVDVYGFMDDTYLYAAYVADTSQPGWSVACSLGVNCNFYYWTPSTAEWPDTGHTLLATGGYPDEVCQTDGSDWQNEGSFVGNGIDIAYEDIMYGTPPGTNVAELKIPLSLLAYAGTNDIIGLGGQYWQYDKATPFYVTPSSTVGLTAETPEITAISADPTSIDFGTVYPGQTVSGDTIVVENIGTVEVEVDAWLSQSGTVFDYLKLGGAYSPGYSGTWDDIISSLLPSISKSFTTELDVPSTYSAVGEETATLIFEATTP